MRFEESIDIDAQHERVWEVLSDLEAWPRRIETVDVVELLTPAPMSKGSRVRLKQPKLPEGTWDITVWDAPSYFEWRQKSGGITSVAGHRVEMLEEGRSRLTLSLEWSLTRQQNGLGSRSECGPSSSTPASLQVTITRLRRSIWYAHPIGPHTSSARLRREGRPLPGITSQV